MLEIMKGSHASSVCTGFGESRAICMLGCEQRSSLGGLGSIAR